MKRIISFALALILCLSMALPVFADSAASGEGTATGETSTGSSEPSRAEETIWYIRTVDGIKQMRLWSITYGRWLTDWIDIGPAD